MAKSIKVLVNTGNEETNKIIDVPADSAKKGTPVRIKAVKGARYQLEDPAAKNVGPENIRSKRVGKNLHVILDGSKDADLIIEGYYDDAMLTENNRGLYGRAEDGKLYEYIPEDPTPAGLPINLADGSKPVSQVLGGGQVGEDFALSGLVLAAAGFNGLGLAAAAVGAAALGGGGGGGGGGGSATPVPSGQTGALADSSDSGVKGDNLTNVTRPTITGKATAGATVEVILKDANGNIVTGGPFTTTADASGNYSVVVGPTGGLPDGTYTEQIKVTNTAGSSTTNGTSFTIDTTPPSGGTGGLTHDATNDSGPSTTDSITSNTHPTFSGTGEPGATVKVTVNGVTLTSTVDSNGNWVTPAYSGANGAGLPDGTHAVQVQFTDKAGNTGNVVNGVPLVVHPTAVLPDNNSSAVVSIDLITQDTGVSANDFVTADNTLIYKGSVTGFASPTTDQVKLELLAADGTTVIATQYVVPTVSGSTATWSWDRSGVTQADGQYTLRASIVDVAGNAVSTAHTQVVVIDTSSANNQPNNSPDTNSSATVAIDTINDPANGSVDSGSSSTDFITNDNTLIIKGHTGSFTSTGATAGDQLLVQIKDPISGAVIATQYVKPDSSGNWVMNNTANVLADGKYTITADIVDLAGNTVKVGTTQALVIDTNQGGTHNDSNPANGPTNPTDPNAGNTVSVAIGGITTDTGFSASDFITSDGTLLISGTTANFSNTAGGVGDKVRVQVVDSVGAVVAEKYVDPVSNAWSFDNQANTLADGNYTIKAAIVDAAGNVVKAALDQPLVISSTAAPTSATVAISGITDDTGVSAVDFITADNTLTFNGTTNGFNSATNKVFVQVLNGNTVVTSGYATVDGSGNWSLVSDATTNAGGVASLSDGSYNIRVVLTNLAGVEVAGTVTTHSLVIDTSSNTNPQNSPSTDPNTASVLSITTINDPTNGSVDSGSSSSDFITNDNTLIVKGAISAFDTVGGAGDKVRVQIVDASNHVVAQQYVSPDANGVWSLDNKVNVLADGKYTIKAIVVDAAGNSVNTEVTHSLVIDTNSGGTDPSVNPGNGPANPTDPNAGGTVSAEIGGITTDSGYSTSDFITNDNTLIINGTTTNFSNTAGAVGDKVRVQLVNSVGAVVAEKYVDPASNAWSFDNTATMLADGNYTIKAAIVDAAGNVVKAAADQPLVINTGNTPTTAALAITSIDDGLNTTTVVSGSKDTGTSSADFITADNTLTITGTTDNFVAGSTDKVFVVVLNGTTVVSSGYATLNGSGANPTWSFAADSTHNTGATADLADGNYTIKAFYTNLTGTVIGQPVAHSLVVDTSASNNPGNSPSTDPNANATLSIDSISDDTGVSSTDFITQDHTLIIKGSTVGFSAANGGAGDIVRVQVFDAAGTTAVGTAVTVTVDSNGNWIWDNTANSLTDGTYTLKANILDAAGNLVKSATNKTVVINNSTNGDPNGSATIVIGGIDDGLSNTTVATGSKDTGISSTDLVTQDGTLTFSGTTTSFNSSVGDQVHLQVINSLNTVVVDQYVSVANNSWAYNNQANGTLTDGVYTLKAAIVNKAGNTVVAATNKTLIIDSSSNINPANNPSTDPNNGGTVTVAVTSIDDGNSGTTAVTGSKDTGTYNYDFVTSDNTLVIKGTTANFSSASGASGDLVNVKLLDAAGTTVIADTYVQPASDGTWTWDRSATVLADGKYNLHADIVDVAGNIVKAGNTQLLVIDTSASNNPGNGGNDSNATSTLTLGVTSIDDGNSATTTANGSKDTGTSNTDFITNDSTLTITGTASGFSSTGTQLGDQLRVQIVAANGSVVTSQIVTVTNGNWVLNNQSNTLADGVYTTKADVLDLAGNIVNTASATQALTIDTSNTQTVTAKYINKDTVSSVGTSWIDWHLYSDGSSKDYTIFATVGTGETLSKVEVFDPISSTWITGKLDGGNLATFLVNGVEPPAGTYTLKFRTTDFAGNLSPETTQTVVVETLPSSSSGNVTAVTGTVETVLPTINVDSAFVGDSADQIFTVNQASIDNYFIDAISYPTRWVNAGAGVDTLKVIGNGTTLDFTKLSTYYNSTKLQGFEIIDLQTDTGNQTVIADAIDLASFSTGGWLTNGYLTGGYQLVVRGNSGDKLVLAPGDNYDKTGWVLISTNVPYATTWNGTAYVNNGQDTTHNYNLWYDSSLDVNVLVDVNVSVINKNITVTSMSPDTGSSSTDFITTAQSLSFSGTVAGSVSGDSVKVYIYDSNGQIIINAATATISGNTWTLASPTSTIALGNYLVKAFLYDSTGSVNASSATQNFILEASNSAPVNTVPSALTTNEDNNLVISGLNVSDTSNNGSSYTVSLGVIHGVLNVSGGTATISGSGTASVTLSGTLAAINATLAATNSVTYVPTLNYNGSDTLSMFTNDGSLGDAKTASSSVAVTVTVHVPAISITEADVPTVLASGSSTTNNAPQLKGTLTIPLLGSESVHIYDGAADLGVATVTGTTWTFGVTAASVATHSYTAKILNGAAIDSTSNAFTLNVVPTPLVLDLTSDGIQTTSVSDGTQFDLLSTGSKQNVGWVSKSSGLLAIDLNGDGQITSGAELFGDHTVLPDGSLAKDGWTALSAQDSNHDGVIDAKDVNFDKLRVWVDVNGDGITDSGELHTLAEEHISSINLMHDSNSVQQNGNVVQAFSTYTTTDGSTHTIADAGFQVQAATSSVFTLSSGNSLNLSGLGNLTQVSTIDMASDSSANTVKLTLADVLGTATTNGVHQLKLIGGANDMADIHLADWIDTGTTVTEGTHTFAVYTANSTAAAQLLIDQAMINANHVS